MANKTTEVSPERRFAQEAQAKHTTVSWHGQRVRVVVIEDEYALCKLVGVIGGTTGSRFKVRFNELKEYCEPLVAPKPAEYASIDDMEAISSNNRDLADAVEDQEETEPEDIEEPVEEMVDVADASTSIVIRVPKRLYQEDMKTLHGWLILDANTKKVWKGANLGWTHTEDYSSGKQYAGDKRTDNAVQGLIGRGFSNLRLITSLQASLLLIWPDYWKHVAFSMKVPTYEGVNEAPASQRQSLPSIITRDITDDEITKAEGRVKIMKSIKVLQSEIVELRIELSSKERNLVELKTSLNAA